MKINKSLITLIIGILSYLYLFNNIDKKLDFVLLYLLLLLFGYFFIKNDIFLYAPILIILDFLKTKYIIEGNENIENNPIDIDAMVTDEQDNQDPIDPDVAIKDDGVKEELKEGDNQEQIINSLTE